MEHYLLNNISVHYIFCHKIQSLGMACSAFWRMVIIQVYCLLSDSRGIVHSENNKNETLCYINLFSDSTESSF